MDEREIRADYSTCFGLGLAAVRSKDFGQAFSSFKEAEALAREINDTKKRLKALNLMARAKICLAGLRGFDEAEDILFDVSDMAINSPEEGLDDELYTARSTLGRIAAIKIVRLFSYSELPEKLAQKPADFFIEVLEGLAESPNYHLRYSNAIHGAVVVALARRPAEADQLIAEGQKVATLAPPKPYKSIAPADFYKDGEQRLEVAQELSRGVQWRVHIAEAVGLIQKL